MFETETIGPSVIDVGGMTPCPPVTMPLCTESSFHVVPYLTRKLFEFIIFFYLTIISLWVTIYTFPNNLKDIKDHI